MNKVDAKASYCTPTHCYSTMRSPVLATVGIIAGGILIALGLLLRSYAGMGTVGMISLTASGGVLMASFLLLQAVNCCIQKIFGPGSMHKAAERGDLTFLKKNLSKINERNGQGETPFQQALQNNSPTSIQFFLQNNANICTTDKNGWTPLHTAIHANNPIGIITALIEKGADLNALTLQQETPLDIAILARHVGAGILLIEKGADLTRKDSEGNTYLMKAMQANGNEKLVDKLIGSGKIDLNARNTQGKTAFDFSWGLHSPAVTIQKLLLAGADPNIQDSEGCFFFHKLIQAKRIEPIKYFIDAGVDLNAKNSEGKTALALAREHTLGTVICSLIQSKGGTV